MNEPHVSLRGADADQVSRIAPYVGRLALAAMAWEGRAIVLTSDGLRRTADFTPEGAIAELEAIIRQAHAELGALSDPHLCALQVDMATIRKVADRLLAPIRELAKRHDDGGGRQFFIGGELERATQDARCVRCGDWIQAGERMQRDPAMLLPVHVGCEPSHGFPPRPKT